MLAGASIRSERDHARRAVHRHSAAAGAAQLEIRLERVPHPRLPWEITAGAPTTLTPVAGRGAQGAIIRLGGDF